MRSKYLIVAGALGLGAVSAEAGDTPSAEPASIAVPRLRSPLFGRLLRREAPPAPSPAPRADDRVRRAQAPADPDGPPSPTSPPSPGRPGQAIPIDVDTPGTDPSVPPTPPANLPSDLPSGVGGQSISLQMALYGALTSNPDLVTQRQGIPNGPSPEAVEVARRFPTALNPTVWIDYRPITLIPGGTFANGPGSSGSGTGTGTGTGTGSQHGFYHFGQNYILFSIRQPIELGHQTTHRFNIARAALSQQQWTILQFELTTLVQTYRLFQTAAYRRERLRVARELADFNDRLLESLQKRLEAGRGAGADVILARVESRSSRQQVKAARQDYLTALADLRNQIGMANDAAAAEPLGEFVLPPYIPPVDEQTMVRTALANRPDIRAARSQVAGAEAAIRLAQGDRIPTPVVGPQYAMDEAGIQYVGLIYVSAIPVLNGGKPLVRQREAEARRACAVLQQAQQRAVAQVRAAVARWNGATDLVNESGGITGELSGEVAKLENLFNEGQADLPPLLQARQRLIQLENLRLDAVWAATQAQADLLLALGTPTMIHAMLNQAAADARPIVSPAPSPPAMPALSPFRQAAPSR